MSIVTLENVSVSFGAEDVLLGITGEIVAGDRIGLVGRNGAGKTTLLRAIAGMVEPASGRAGVRRGNRIALVEQVPTFPEQGTVWEIALSGASELLEMEQALRRAAETVARSPRTEADDRYATLQREFEARGGFGLQVRAEQALTGLGLGRALWETPVGQLSGGQRSRLALARALVAGAALLLLDEPTNHLDLDGLRWLEGFLARWRGSLVVTSHDRYFLDRVATRIWLLQDRRLRAYRGNYSAFETQHAEEMRRERDEYEAQQALVAKEEAFIRRYHAGQRAREARGRQRRLDRLDRLDAPSRERHLALRLGARRSGDIVLETSGVTGGYGEVAIVRTGRLRIERGERIALLGPNGAGKSTLIRTIAGELSPVDGDLRLGAGVRVAHYRQEAEDLDPGSTVLEELLRVRDLDLQAARDHLGLFLFSGDDALKPISALSGGERNRLALARLVLVEANLLLLDEPTNHLDIPAREALEAGLKAYPGALIMASHDRRLVEMLADRLWAIEDGVVRVFDGGLEEYERERRRTSRQDRPPSRPRERPRPPATDPSQARRAELEAEIGRIEDELASLGDEINRASAAGNVESIRALGERFRELRSQADRLWEEWATT